MINKAQAYLGVMVALFAVNGVAGTDPVSWSLSPSTGFPSVEVGNSSSVTYTLTNHLPFAVKLHTYFVENPSSEFTITDECNNESVHRNGGTCTVTIAFTPVNTAQATIQMKYGYDKNLIPVPQLKVTGSGTANVTGVISDLPSTISLLQSPTITITYTNNSHGTTVTGWIGNAEGEEAVTTDPTSVATIALVPDTNSCGTKQSPAEIKPQHSCSLQAQVTPVSLGNFEVSALYAYNNGDETVNPTANSEVVSTPPPPSDCLTGSAVLIFPTDKTYRYSDNVLKFMFTNSCDTATAVLPTITFAASGTSSDPTILGNPNNASFDECSGHSVAAHSSCTVLVSVIPQNTGTISITASTNTSPEVTATTNTVTVQQPTYAHNVTFINYCPFTVWYGVTQPSGSSDPTPSPSVSAYALAAPLPGQPPVAKTISFGSSSYGGIFVPRTGCQPSGNSFVCQTGDCGSGANGKCSATAYEPFTRVEEVFYIPSSVAQGNYDIALENGGSIPVEFKGLGPSTSQYANPAASFVCSGAGAPIPIPFTDPPYTTENISLGSCPWTYTLPDTPSGSSPMFRYVTNETPVTNCNVCVSSTCGIAYDSIPPVTAQLVLACGQLVGYWTLDQFASFDKSVFDNLPDAYNPYKVYKFASLLTAGNGFQSGYPVTGLNPATVQDLYSRTPKGNTLSTCYPSVEGTLCCGARNWNNPSDYLTAQASNANEENTDWRNANTTLPLPLSPYESILWLKDACPTNYSYPWDDQSSSFNRNYSDAAQTTAADMDFEIVFCPGGLYSGLSLNP